jgi:hypothetical protein
MFSKEYIAGIVDGEGCLRFGINRGVIHPQISVTNTYLPLLEQLKLQYGGCISRQSKGKIPNNKWKNSYLWRVTSKQAITFLEDIGKFLFIKRKQKFLLFVWNVLRPGKGGKFNDVQKHILLQKISEYNKKGR